MVQNSKEMKTYTVKSLPSTPSLPYTDIFPLYKNSNIFKKKKKVTYCFTWAKIYGYKKLEIA
jgi:hypothetical protein